MKELGADLPKYAVMPRSPEDVLALLWATLQAAGRWGRSSTMSMGELGKVSRACGGMFGSCLTFGAGQNASARGQLNAEDLRAHPGGFAALRRGPGRMNGAEGKDLVP